MQSVLSAQKPCLIHAVFLANRQFLPACSPTRGHEVATMRMRRAEDGSVSSGKRDGRDRVPGSWSRVRGSSASITTGPPDQVC